MAVDGHLGMTALSRVTLASAGLSCPSQPWWSRDGAAGYCGVRATLWFFVSNYTPKHFTWYTPVNITVGYTAARLQIRIKLIYSAVCYARADYVHGVKRKFIITVLLSVMYIYIIDELWVTQPLAVYLAGLGFIFPKCSTGCLRRSHIRNIYTRARK